MPFLLIKDGVVVNSILANSEFVDQIRGQYDEVVEVEGVPGDPGVGWLKSGAEFSPPPPPDIVIPDTEGVTVGGIDFSDADLTALAAKLSPKLKAMP